MEQVLQLAVVVFAAFATGGLMVNWVGLVRAMSRLSVSTYVEFHQATNRTFDPYMPIVVVGALLDGIVLAILSQGIHSILWRARCSGICSSYVLQPPINRIAPRSMPGTGSEANDEVAMKALAKDPMRRHQTAREFARNL